MSPRRGEVWLISLDPVVGHEQAGTRSCVVVSTDIFNSGPVGLVMVVPMSSRQRPVPLHVAIAPPIGGVRMASDILCEDLRAVSANRLVRRLSEVPTDILDQIADRLRIILDL